MNRYKVLSAMFRVLANSGNGLYDIWYANMPETLTLAEAHEDIPMSDVAYALRGRLGVRCYNLARKNLFAKHQHEANLKARLYRYKQSKLPQKKRVVIKKSLKANAVA